MDNMKKILFALAALLSLAACNSNKPAPATDGKAIVESIMTRTSSVTIRTRPSVPTPSRHCSGLAWRHRPPSTSSPGISSS